ncbi:MAG: hypothetical protein IKY44_03220 [Clostridia bacterium]|nr:hypothetical protein [Clostridia bacterium]
MSFMSINDMLDQIVGVLEERLDADVMRQFPPRTKSHPLSKISVSVGIKKSTADYSIIGMGRKISAEIELSAFVPLTMDSKLAYSTIDEAAMLIMSDPRFGASEYSHGVLSPNRATGSFEIHGTLTSTLYETEE